MDASQVFKIDYVGDEIPGGVSPGTNLIRPDLPELLHFPFLWQEGEYCLGGHATWFMYMVLASQKILNGNEQ